MEILLYFLFGVAFVQYIIPLLDSLSSLILTWIEVGKGKLSVKITHYNKELHKQEDDTKVILGFAPEKDDEDD